MASVSRKNRTFLRNVQVKNAWGGKGCKHFFFAEGAEVNPSREPNRLHGLPDANDLFFNRGAMRRPCGRPFLSGDLLNARFRPRSSRKRLHVRFLRLPVLSLINAFAAKAFDIVAHGRGSLFPATCWNIFFFLVLSECATRSFVE